MDLHEKIPKMGLDALLFNTSDAMRSINLRYLSGFTGSEATVLITPTERHLFTDGRYTIQARQQAPGYGIHIVKKRIDALARLSTMSRIRRLGVEAARVSHEFVTALARTIPNLTIVPIGRDFLERLRIRKTPMEKEKISLAARIASQSCRRTLDAGLGGMKESEVAAELEGAMRRLGGEATAFDTIVASGERSALPHGTATGRVIGRGELVIVDYGCRVEGYHSDETVTCVVGKPTQDQKKIHRSVYDAHMRALDALKVGIRVRQVDRIARQSIEKDGFGRNFVHGLGHGVGMEIHEAPSVSQRGRGVVEDGMVFTIEPGIYLEGVGGVRLESLVYITGTGPEILSLMPKDLISVE